MSISFTTILSLSLSLQMVQQVSNTITEKSAPTDITVQIVQLKTTGHVTLPNSNLKLLSLQVLSLKPQESKILRIFKYLPQSNSLTA